MRQNISSGLPSFGYDADIDSLRRDLEKNVDGEVRFDTASRAIYSTDSSNYRQVPIGVVVPRSTDAVVKTVEICRRHGAPLLSRGGGTSLDGQTCNTAVVIDHSKYRNHVVDLDQYGKLAWVEPGCILDDLRQQAEEYHLTFGPDPATHTHNTLGGMIGNNSCGIHSVMAGKTVDNVEELDILTYDGLRMTVGKTDEDELNRIIAEGGRRGEIYRRLRDIRDKYADLIRERYPKIPRRVSGYNLDQLLPENGFNVARALVGTQSTCVTILNARVRLVDSPPYRSLLLLGYPDVFTAGDHIPQVLEFQPVGLEGIDDTLIKYMQLQGMHPKDLDLLPAGGGWLIVEFGGESKFESDQKARNAMESLKHVENPPSMKLYTDTMEEAHIWKLRENGLGATSLVPGKGMAWPGWEDAAVPPDKVGAYLREFKKLLDEFNLECSLYGHFGQGCIHCSIPFDLFTEKGVKDFMRFLDRASDLVVEYGGSFSAEHGDGQGKAMYLPKMYGPELMDAFREFKNAWDPDWKMNPGKVVNSYRPDQNLRLGTDYTPWNPSTYFRFPQDNGSFAQATLRCFGVGDCRRTQNTFMCPSFVATREEEHTTRGRARVLFEMFKGDIIKDGWRSKAVMESLDLCLACKGCKVQCPIRVDMATYKAEFLAHHFHRRLRPRDAYTMGLIEFWARIGSRIPSIANFLLNAPVIGNISKFLGGIAPKRSMPKFAEQTFTAWFRNRAPENVTGASVVLYPDAFNNSFFPETLKAAALVLERWGFRVIVPKGTIRDVRPLIHYGFLESAKRGLKNMIRDLHPYLVKGTPIIFLEPSTAAVFRDELTALYPDDLDGQRLTKQTYILGEFIEERNLEVPRMDGRAVYHGHCHQKAVLRPEDERNVLRKMGVDFSEPEPGCCGMAGSFGFEIRHYDLSQKIGEENLFPAIRRAGDHTLIIADGFSCRRQILDAIGRQPLHLSEVLLMAFEQSGGIPKKEEKQGEAEPVLEEVGQS